MSAYYELILTMPLAAVQGKTLKKGCERQNNKVHAHFAPTPSSLLFNKNFITLSKE